MHPFKKKILTLTVLVFACLVAAQTIPPVKIEIAYSSRVSSYDYRIVTDGAKQYLEMRQTGKQKWARIEEVTCTHGPGRFESESFDHATICE